MEEYESFSQRQRLNPFTTDLNLKKRKNFVNKIYVFCQSCLVVGWVGLADLQEGAV